MDKKEIQTVRNCLTQAYGGVPKGAIHFGWKESYYDGGDGKLFTEPIIVDDEGKWFMDEGLWQRFNPRDVKGVLQWGCDIQDAPAWCFIGYFGDEYDELVTPQEQ